MKIKISEMSGKLKGIQAINTNPLSNLFCQSMNASGNDNCICTHCYSCSMLLAYRKNCIPSFEYNSFHLRQDSFNENDIPKFNKKNDIIRLHAYGELQNATHLKNLLKIVEVSPEKTFSLYTKRLDIINDVLGITQTPSNLILVFSNPLIDAPILVVPKYFHKVFNVLRATNLNKINCGSKNCNSCRNCYDKTKTNILYEMIK